MTGALVIGGGSWGTALARPSLRHRHAADPGARPETSALLADGRCRQLADLPPVDGFDATTDPSAISEAEMVSLSFRLPRPPSFFARSTLWQRPARRSFSAQKALSWRAVIRAS